MRLSTATLLAVAGLIVPEMALAAETAPSEAVAASTTSDYAIATTPASSSPTSAPEATTIPEFSTATASMQIASDLVVQATNIQIVGVNEELANIASRTIRTRLGGQTSQRQLQQDVALLQSTGLFESVEVTSFASDNGLDVVFQVQPATLKTVQLNNAKVLTPQIANQIFAPQLGQTLTPSQIQQGIEQVNQWYQDNGYILAQVVDARTLPGGILSVDVAEGVVNSVNLRFYNRDGETIEGRTNQSYVREALSLEPGQIFRVDTAREDLRSLYQTGLFAKADIDIQGDPSNLDITYELTETGSRGIDAGGGYSDSAGLFGSIRYNDKNLGGMNQQLGLDVQVGTRDVQFNANYGRAYRQSHPDRVGYNINAFRQSTESATFNDMTLSNGDRPRERQLGGGVSVSQPLGEWNASVGAGYTRHSIRDSEGNLAAVDQNGNPLSFSNTGIDDLVTVEASVSRDLRDNPANPTSGSKLKFSTEQSVPVGNGSILMNRVRADYTQYIPTNVFQQDSPEVFAFNVQGGTAIGDLPPYQAFTIGGANSVRGYGNGDVASGRSYVLASAEYRVPLFNSPVSGVLFADFGTDLGSGNTVPGEPGTTQGKPGSGFGYGTGVRVDSPLGVIRADFGLNDRGDSQFHFGLGHRF
ncbi:MAG: BamA/TamA family outer membrane protein [Jaaginema sp. PMC 1079.18]|nr:BamA/TamA family outer membrane protein [Jaaginema sp. PMC 1080.18]MEC4853559.1 BamA/TamA family outer membrane protein [Jaaginema sp. PMC 1079.18]MEC4868804.1 BamA/TamA family outer membrane protein [Jaaginema sp. PMC 1078.18]